MTDEQEQKLIRESSRGAKARAILEDEFVQEALQAVEVGILEAWKKSPVRDLEGQTSLRLLYKVFNDFKGYFADALATGKMANVQLAHERSLRERARAAMKEFVR